MHRQRSGGTAFHQLALLVLVAWHHCGHAFAQDTAATAFPMLHAGRVSDITAEGHGTFEHGTSDGGVGATGLTGAGSAQHTQSGSEPDTVLRTRSYGNDNAEGGTTSEAIAAVRAEYYHERTHVATISPAYAAGSSYTREEEPSMVSDNTRDPYDDLKLAEMKRLEKSDPLLQALDEVIVQQALQHARATPAVSTAYAMERRQQEEEEEAEEEASYDVTVLLAAAGTDSLMLLNCLRSLRTNLPQPSRGTSSWELVIVQVGSGLGERERILAAIDAEWIAAAGPDAPRLLSPPVRVLEERGMNLSHAFNLAASLAHGRYLLFFLESMEVPPRSGFTFPAQKDNVLDYLVSVVHDFNNDNLPGVVGAKVIYGGEDVVHHAGIGWLNVRFPHEHLVWGDDADARGNVPFPYFQSQGLHTHNKRVNNLWEEGTPNRLDSHTRYDGHDDEEEEVYTVMEKNVPLRKRRQAVKAVGVKGMFTSRRLFRQLGGFHTAKFSDQYFDVDYCLRAGGLVAPSAPSPSLQIGNLPASPVAGRARFMSPRLRVFYDPHAVFYHYDSQQHHEEALSPQSPDAIAFADKWEAHPTLRALVDRSKHGGLANTTVIWNMECGLGQVLGFTVEGINFVLGLNDLVYVMVEPTAFDACYKDLQKAGMPASRLAVFRAANQRRVDAPQEAGNTVYLVLHRDPGRYSSHLYDLRGAEPDYIIGRSMYETNTIPFPWIGSSSKVDEIWVPSDFNVKTFASAGIPEKKLHQIGEALDASVFDPEAVQRPLPLANKAKFNFVTNGKWEQRKGWDVLLRAYYEEFKGTDDVALHFVARMNAEAKAQYLAFQRNISHELGVPVGKLPRVEFATEIVPFGLMPALYKAADAFVLATHGEGWGLPLMEAMAMHVPVIATNWSGNTQFMNRANSFGIEVEGLIPASAKEHLWARPSHTHLRHLMRLVYTAHAEPQSPEHSRVRAAVEQARRDIMEHWSLDAVARSVVDRLRAIKSSGRLAEAKLARTPAFSRYSTYGSSSSSAITSTTATETPGRKKIKIVNDI